VDKQLYKGKRLVGLYGGWGMKRSEKERFIRGKLIEIGLVAFIAIIMYIMLRWGTWLLTRQG